MVTAPLRVMHMIGAAKPGGAEMFALRLLVALLKVKQIELLVVVRKGWLERALRAEGVPVQVVPFGGMLDLRTKRMVAKIARDFQPQVIQSWMNRATRFVPKGPWATVARLGGFYDLKYYKGRVRNLICNTHAICEYCITHGWEAADVAMISNFIPEPAEDWRQQRKQMRVSLKIKEGSRVLMMAGRLHKVKGVDVALRSLAELPERFILLLVGDGPLRSELEQLARKLGVAKRVRWAGWQDDISPYAAAADTWLAPSRHEPLGNTVLDGWVHEIPVVASRTGGLKMLVEEGKSGLLVEVDDVGNLRDAVLQLDGDKEMRLRVTAGGMKSFRRDYSEDGIVGKYVAYYRRLAEKAGTGAGTGIESREHAA